MKPLIIFLALLVTSCGLFKRGRVEAETIAPPPIIETEDGRTFYIPDFVPSSTTGESWELDNALVCEYDQFSMTIAQSVDTHAVKNVYYTNEDVIERIIDRNMLYGFKIMRSDFIHLEAVELAAVSGDTLRFLKWITTKLDGNLVVWSDEVFDPATPSYSELSFDGSIDISNFLTEIDEETASIKFIGTARGKSPSATTRTEIKLHLISFYDCR